MGSLENAASQTMSCGMYWWRAPLTLWLTYIMECRKWQLLWGGWEDRDTKGVDPWFCHPSVTTQKPDTKLWCTAGYELQLVPRAARGVEQLLHCSLLETLGDSAFKSDITGCKTFAFECLCKSSACPRYAAEVGFFMTGFALPLSILQVSRIALQV